MIGVRRGWHKSVTASVTIGAEVPGEALGVIGKADLIVSLSVTASAEDEFTAAIALKAVAWDDVEHSVGAVTEVGLIAAALDVEIVNVERVDGGAYVAGDVGVGDLDTVDKPAELVTAADVKHVMHHVGAWSVVGNHGQAVSATGSGRLDDLLAADEGGGRHGVWADVGRLGADLGGLRDGGDGERKMQDRTTVGRDGEDLLEWCEVCSCYGDDIDASRDAVEAEDAVGAGGLAERECGMRCVQSDVSAVNGTVLGIVHDALHGRKDGGKSGLCDEAECDDSSNESGKTAHSGDIPLSDDRVVGNAGWHTVPRRLI